jgi:hypothetical protein
MVVSVISCLTVGQDNPFLQISSDIGKSAAPIAAQAASFNPKSTHFLEHVAPGNESHLVCSGIEVRPSCAIESQDIAHN